MANYYCTIRTNYFKVKDETAFRDFMSRVTGCEDNVELFERRSEDGSKFFGFGCYGNIAGVIDPNIDDPDDTDNAYDEFIQGLQKQVADDDAIIILESGSEKMRYVIGQAAVITSKQFEYLDITHLAIMKASEMLANPNWQTICEY